MAMKTFYDRLVFVLCEEKRKRHPWGESLGLTPSTVGRMFSGQIPGHEILTRIQRVENVSQTWLVTGEGAPFLVAQCRTDAEARATLRDHLEEAAWEITLIRCEPDYALVLTQPCQIEADGNIIKYRCLQLIAGAGPLTLRAALESGRPLRSLQLPHADFTRLVTGWMSNLELLGAPDIPGLLESATSVQQSGFVLPQVAEESALYGLPQDERELLDCYRSLPADKKNALLVLLKK
jgi:hypothetical protein